MILLGKGAEVIRRLFCYFTENFVVLQGTFFFEELCFTKNYVNKGSFVRKGMNIEE